MEHRIAIVGSTGSGKTTLGSAAANRLAIPFIELDAIHWLPDWQERTHEGEAALLDAATARPAWVCDGNYSRLQRYTVHRATTLVWLDYPLAVNALRLLRRTVVRSARREELWSGNRETFRKAFLRRDSILLWLWQSYDRNRARYGDLFKDPALAHVERLRMAWPQDADRWLASLPARG